MRISTGMIYDSGLASIQNRTSTLLNVQQQLASGRRILKPSDDPVAAARALEVSQSIAANKAQATTRDSAKSSVGLADAQLQSASDLLARVHELTVQAGDASLSAEDRRSVAMELRQRFDELLAIANSKDGVGNSLFGGFQVSNKPFAGSVEDGVTYTGDDGQRALQVSNSRLLGISQSGNDIFMKVKNGNGVFVTGTLDDKIISSSGAVINKGTVTDPVAWSASSGNLELQFLTATTYQLVDVSNNSVITSGTYTPGAAPAGPPVGQPSGQVITVSSIGASVTVSGTPAAGDAFVIKADTTYTSNGFFVTEPKTATLYNTGSGIIDTGSVTDVAKWNSSKNSRNLEIRFQTDPTDVSIPKTTYYDLVDRETGFSLYTGTASTSGTVIAGNHVFKSGDAIPFSGLQTNTYGDGISTGDFGISVTISGDPASGDAFKVGASESQSIFTTLGDTIKLLESSKAIGTMGNTQLHNQLGGLLTSLSQAEDSILTARALSGSSMSEVDSLDSVGESLHIQFQDTLSRLQDLDYAEAITKLNRQQMELQAAQQSFSKISKLSLFDYIG